MGKWLKIGAFALGAAIVAPQLGFDSRLGAAAGGFAAGGPIGAVAGYVGAPTLLGLLGQGGGASGTSSVPMLQ